MLQYILECITFQLVFLIIYDQFLKGETFFQWNRLYLIGTYFIAMILPWVKIEAMKTTMPEAFQTYPEFLWGMNDAAVVGVVAAETNFNMSWEYILLFGGMLLSVLFFGYKLYQIYALKQKGEVHYFKDFTRIIIANSSMAFSFFKSIFLGDKVIAKEHQNILQHELVHIRQGHSYDLLFFELMRIVGWFNPLVYVYQSRVSELHEFIADAQVAKTDKKEQYELLLSEVFQTQNISFINQFFKSSLIKKRIVMLQKTKSKKLFKLKYLLLIPIILGMLLYTSCDFDESSEGKKEIESTMLVSSIEKMSKKEEEKLFLRLKSLSDKGGEWQYLLKDESSSILYESSINDSYIKFEDYDDKIYATMTIQGSSMGKGKVIGSDKNGMMVPFSVVDEVPIFPGCANENNKRKCFNEMMQKHIRKNFRYPKEAQEQGIQGRVSVMFTVGAEGDIQNVRMRGPNPILEKEVARIINRLPKMQPGKQAGKVVGVPFSIPIVFKLQQSSFSNFSNKKDAEESEGLTKELFNGVYKDIIPFSKVDEAPIFPNCENSSDKSACFQESMRTHIRKHFNYPEEAQEKGLQGRVAVLFIIAKDGTIKDLKTRGPDKLLEDEAARIISRLPKMMPAKHKGELSEVAFSIPITFKLK